MTSHSVYEQAPLNSVIVLIGSRCVHIFSFVHWLYLFDKSTLISISGVLVCVIMTGLEMISNYTNLVSNLERQELGSSDHGPPSPQIYGQLLAIYLLINDLPNAKLLWKRIPMDIKEHHPEIQAVWNVGVKLSQRDLRAIYPLVEEFEWPGHLKNIMNCIKESTRERTLTLISKAYSSIRLTDLCAYLGMNENDTIAKITSLLWAYSAETGFVTPVKLIASSDEPSPASFDQLMTKLTEYVAFLEN